MCTIVEKKQDLFTVDDKYYLAHCVSADFAMGAGIALKFVENFPELKELRKAKGKVGNCVKVNRVFNLITKEKYHKKPTYYTLDLALNSLKELIIKEDIKFIAIPHIACGLDRLNWNKVKNLIESTFKKVNVEILICCTQ